MTTTLPPKTAPAARGIAVGSGAMPETGTELVRRADVSRALAVAQRITARPVCDPRPARIILEEAWARDAHRR